MLTTVSRPALLVTAPIAIGGCANSYQSARTLEPGRTQAALAGSRGQLYFEDGGTDGSWMADLQVRHGFHDRFDAGIRYHRMPEGGRVASLLQLDPKVALTSRASRWPVAVAMPFGLGWSDTGLRDFDNGTYVITPTVFVGYDVMPTLELVASPKLFFVKPGNRAFEVSFGGSVGIRLTDARRTWAIHPEIGLARLTDGPDDDTLLVFGIAFAAGT